jgi:hypothetical protein
MIEHVTMSQCECGVMWRPRGGHAGGSGSCAARASLKGSAPHSHGQSAPHVRRSDVAPPGGGGHTRPEKSPAIARVDVSHSAHVGTPRANRGRDTRHRRPTQALASPLASYERCASTFPRRSAAAALDCDSAPLPAGQISGARSSPANTEVS